MAVLVFNLEDRSPFVKEFHLSKDARLPDLEIQLLDVNTPVDLTGATVTFSMDDLSGTTKVNAAAGTVSDATNGKVKYAWAAVDVDTTGTFKGQFVITISSKDYRIPDNGDQLLRIIIAARVN